MAKNKVRFGLKNVHIALLTESTDDATPNTWAAPIAVPGAVSIDIASEQADNVFYADNIAYYRSLSNNGYTGTLEMALIPPEILKAVWDMTETGDVLYEYSGVQPKPFALLFQVEGDDNETCYAFYRVLPTSKPTENSQTIEDTVEPVTQSFDFAAMPLIFGPLTQKNLIKGRTEDTTSAATKTAWFTAVNVPV